MIEAAAVSQPASGRPLHAAPVEPFISVSRILRFIGSDGRRRSSKYESVAVALTCFIARYIPPRYRGPSHVSDDDQPPPLL